MTSDTSITDLIHMQDGENGRVLRIVASLVGAVFSTVALFYFMAWLVTGPSKNKLDRSADQIIEFVRLKPISQTQVRKRELPKKPPPQKMPPKTPKLKIAAKQQNVAPQPVMDAPKLDVPLAITGGAFIGQAGAGGVAGGGDQEVLPLVRIEPRFPRKAAMQGTEGWVKLSFDITAAGTVTNVEVLESMPKRIFDGAARSALLKWKYRPKVEDGKAVPRVGNKVQIDFKLR